MCELISRSEAKAKGLTRYFTGKPCKHGHVSDRKTVDGKCSECHKERCRSTKKDPNKHRETNKRYRANNVDKIAKRKTEYAANNRDRVREANRRSVARKFSRELSNQIETGKSLPNILSEFDAMDIFKATSTDTFVWDTGVKE